VAGVLCAGNVLVDILARPVAELLWDATTWIDEVAQGLGGNGANTSFALAKLGARVKLMGMLGADPFGDYCRSTLSAVGVDLSLVGVARESTACSVVLVRPDGARALLHRPGASREAFPQPVLFDPATVDGCGRFHLANVFGLPLMRAHAGQTLANARAAGLATSLDTGWDARGQWMEVAAPCLPHVDLLFVNQDEARMLSGSEDPGRVAGFFRDRGVGAVVVKLGAGGCAVFGPGVELRAPAYRVDVVDTTGAGDCFAGAFLSCLERGESMRDAARFANAVGAIAIQSLGSTTGLLDRDATLGWMRSRALP
jgi:sugar/nucleoside kinase (ribokinase family)